MHRKLVGRFGDTMDINPRITSISALWLLTLRKTEKSFLNERLGQMSMASCSGGLRQRLGCGTLLGDHAGGQAGGVEQPDGAALDLNQARPLQRAETPADSLQGHAEE